MRKGLKTNHKKQERAKKTNHKKRERAQKQTIENEKGLRNKP